MIDRIPVPIRIAAAVAWTALMVFLMLSPGQASIADDLSTAFGATELSDALGHLFIALVEALLVFGAMRPFASVPQAIVVSAVITMVLGALLEAAQLWIPSRGATVLDFAAHTLGVTAATAGLWVRRRFRVSGSLSL